MTTATLSRPILVDLTPGAVSEHVDGRAEAMLEAGAYSRERHGAKWAHYLVGGVGDVYKVRLTFTPFGWTGECEHWKALDIPQAWDAGACSHIVVAARAEAVARGCEVPAPHRPAPPEPPADPTERAVWREQRRYETEGFYD